MVIKLYNTLKRKKEIFKSIEKNIVKIYSCGPTVYWYQHIGNMRMYVFTDILKRVFKHNNYNVKHIINVTDVGHLTSDQDTGDDKVEIAAKREGRSAKDVTEYYFKVMLEDLKKLNILMPDKWPRATEHIKEQIDLIKKLEKKGYTYKTSDGIYFDTSKVKDYGKLGMLKVENLQAGKRIDLGEKKNKTDFSLWKFSKIPGVRQQEWESPWGMGFPGWHIECSAMSSKYLGEQFDIHTGGEEHITIHHPNEICQSESAFGKKPWVGYWLHLRWLVFKGEKMSKSKGEIYTITELEKKGYKPLDFRYFCLTGHYRTPLDFSFQNLDNSKNSLKRLKNIVTDLKDDKKFNEKYMKKFEKCINDDFDTSKALQVLWELVRDKDATGKLDTIADMDSILGLDLLIKDEFEIPDEVMKLVKEREDARSAKDFAKSDLLREKINKLGFSVDDTSDGSKVRKI
ncbi:cysteine--tRNA ligase [Candidatus Pacearchaeota archaeon]|nr:cysteine--tRNA ligase [Candidatus Pacearchaeota archaeon]